MSTGKGAAVSEAKEPVRVGFVGAGTMGQMAHLRNYVSLPECEVVALAELRPELAKRVAAKYEVPAVYADAASMLQNENLDCLVASQQFVFHGQIIPPLYKSGLPVLTEKPLASSPETGRRMLEQLKNSGSWHMIGYHKRSDPATAYVKEKIEEWKASGELGAMRYVRILMPAGDFIAGGFNELISSEERVPPLELDAAPQGLDDEATAAYNIFVNYYIHQVNLMRYLLGERYQVTYADPSGVHLAVRSDSGIAGSIEMSPYSTSLAWQESALVCFERGWLLLELPAPLASNRPGKVTVFRDVPGQEAQTVIPELPWEGAMRAQARNFIRAVRGEILPLCEAEEALEDLNIARDYLRLWKGV